MSRGPYGGYGGYGGGGIDSDDDDDGPFGNPFGGPQNRAAGNNTPAAMASSLGTSLSNGMQSIGNTVGNAAQSAANAATGAAAAAGAGVGLGSGAAAAAGSGGGSWFSNPFGSGGGEAAAAAGSYDYTNNIVTKFVFLVLVLILFVFFLYLGLNLIGYVVRNNSSPYIVRGLVPGNVPKVISQNPSLSDSVALHRSHDRPAGIEFTYSFWLLITSNKDFVQPKTVVGGQYYGNKGMIGTMGDMYQHVFNVGSTTLDAYKNVMTVNGPGVYLRKNTYDNADNRLLVLMDTVETQASSLWGWDQKGKGSYWSGGNNLMHIDNIPTMKWVHVAVRVQGTTMDTYVNGTVSNKVVFDSVPSQNYYDVNLCQNGGFHGSLSNLQYFDHALSVFDINAIVYAGPNLTQSASIADTTSYGKPYYLSNLWYSEKVNP